MSLLGDTRQKLVISWAWHSRAAGNNDEIAADRIKTRSSLFTSDEIDKDEKT